MIHRGPAYRISICAALLLASAAYSVESQAPPRHRGTDQQAAGDAPDNPGPLASGLSPRLAPTDINRAMHLVADWQLSAAEPTFNQQWTYAALYDGLIAASKATGDMRYADAVEEAAADQFHWQLLDYRFPHADDEALGQAYLDLYRMHPDPVRIANVREVMDRLIARPDDPNKLLWWWCDALFMAPPVLTRMYAVTGDRKYLDYMDREWWLTSSVLYNQQQHLFSRDESYLNKKEKNGQPLFWARGNGWVLAALANVLEFMPADYPTRPRYVAQFQTMAARIAGLQQPDGLWKTGLLDPEAYTSSEVSGTAFFTFAMAWGINHGLLDPQIFRPVVQRAWAGMLTHVYANGRLGSIQKIGAAPDTVTPSSSYVYGVGGFLLAGSELDKMKKSGKPNKHSH